MPRPQLLLAAVLALAFAAPVSAQPKGRKVAFLVGVGDFRHNLPNLGGSPQKDVTELAKVLREGGFEVVLLTDKAATKEAVESRFKGVLTGGGKAKALTRHDLLLVAGCTHGFTLPPAPGKPDAPFLAAHDSRSDDPSTMVALNGLIEAAKPFGPTTLFLIDACREIKDANRGTRGVEGTQSLLPEGMAILFSCGRGQVSHQHEKADGHGLFTFAVLKALRGEGTLKDEVTWAGLVFEVERAFRSSEFKKMIPAGKPQTPFLAAGELDATELMRVDPLAADYRAYRAALYAGNPAVLAYLRVATPTRLATWREQAERGNPTGQLLYAVCFATNVGVARDDTEATRWYEKAAAGGHPLAMVWAGAMHADGRGVRKDEAEAVRWYRQAADAGEPVGMNNLGIMYAAGRGLPKDAAEAAKWYKKAADAGYATGMTNLGNMYAAGRGGLPKDDAEAVKWYKKAADAGHARGMTWLGVFHFDGRGGLAKNEAEAARFYRKAADAGESVAMANLALMYEHGRGGLPKDEAEAVKWYKKAAAAGNDGAKDHLKRLGKE